MDDLSLTCILENTSLSLLGSGKNVGSDFRMCFRHKKQEERGDQLAHK